jgi:hypothetical protein
MADRSRAMAKASPKLTLEDQFGADVVGFARAAVTAARPGPQHKVPTIVRYACEYVSWALAADSPLDPAVLFSASRVDAYYRHLCDSGTSPSSAAPVRSFLKRLHPAVGLTSTTRGRGPDAARRTRVTLGPSLAVDLTVKASPAVASELATFRPTIVPDHMWPTIQPIVLAVVLATRVDRVQRAKDLFRSAAMLVGWVHSEGRPLRPELVFDATTVSGFADRFWEVAHRPSLATHISNLRSIAAGLGVTSAPPLGGYTADVTYAYDDAHIAELENAIAAVRQPRRRRSLSAIELLAFGAGYTPMEMCWAQPSHLVDIDGAVHAVIHTPERWDLRLDVDLVRTIFGDAAADADAHPGLHVRATVRILDRWQALAVQVRETAISDGEEFLLGGDGEGRRGRYDTVLNGGKHGGAKIEFSYKQARLRWMADFAGPTLEPLRDALGVSTLDLKHMFRDWS